MLYQPTNVTPSMTGGLGNGVIDADKDLTVSWQVNGNTAMDSFSIAIYKNDTASTSVYSTGTKTDGCPFYGIAYNGDVQLFSYTISASVLSTAGIRNGNEYKLVVTQTSGSTSVTQTAASVFLTRATPEISIADIPSPLAYTKYAFSLNYPSSGDPLNWMRWRIASWTVGADEPDRILYDSGDIYGTADLRCTYDGFLSGERYGISCDIETVYGVQVSTGWVQFEVQYDLLDYTGSITAKKICGHTGVKLTWDGIIYIPGTADGTYSVLDGSANLENGASIYWDKVNEKQMRFEQPWTILFRGKISTYPAKVTLQCEGKTITVYVDSGGKWIYIKVSDTTSSYGFVVNAGNYVSQFAITPTDFYYEMMTPASGLFPSTTLYPNASVYPAGVDTYTGKTSNIEITYEQTAIQKITVAGPIEIDYLWVVNKELSETEVNSVFDNESFSPSFIDGSGTVFAATFDNGVGAGSVAQVGTGLDSFIIYRKDNGRKYLKRIGSAPMLDSAFYDFGVTSQSAYKYYLYLSGNDQIEFAPAVSDDIYVCFWDWVILECTEDDAGSYIVRSEYLFGKNLSSGSVSNNNVPNILTNFTQYPLVQLSGLNYRSGTLSSLIGVIRNGKYSDTIAVRDEIYALSTTKNTLFLKNRKGDLMQIRISGAISMDTMDATAQQAQTASIPWVEVGNAEGKPIIAKESDFTSAL